MQAKKGATIQQLRARWNNMAQVYNSFDATMQTFYYTLVNMLQLREAKHVLEIACGLGKMIPYAVTQKKEETTYLATDLSQNMVEMAQVFIDNHLKKFGVTISTEEWLLKHQVKFQVHNGEEILETPYKFDRIICNLVLMITENPQKMLRSLHAMSEEGCLLGLTVWGDKTKSNFMTLPEKYKIEKGIPLPNIRENFHLFNKLGEIASETGWELIIQWQQNAPFNVYDFSQDLEKMIKTGLGDVNEEIIQYMRSKVKETFESKQPLNFPTQLAIFRRK